jgi:hypothetical protein
MSRRSWRLLPAVGGSLLLVWATALMGAASAAPAGPRTTAASGSFCKGTFKSPGNLAGDYAGSVEVVGVCTADGAPVTVHGNLTIAAGSVLDATFALDGANGARTSVTVEGNVDVDAGAVLFLGCEPLRSPCTDSPTLTTDDVVAGGLVADQALGVVVHATSFGGDVTETGGGGGGTCKPVGAFADFQSPPFSDFEDDRIGGSLTLDGLRGCWTGVVRDRVAGDLTYDGNLMGDPDAAEVNQNAVGGNLACSGNSPAVQYGDAGSSPNVVAGAASGECAFDVEASDPRWYFDNLVPRPNEEIVEPTKLPLAVPAGEAIGISPSHDGGGYLLAHSDGAVARYGDAAAHGSWSGALPFPVTAFADTPTGGYWLATSTGVVQAFGGAPAVGPSGGVTSAYPIVGMAPTPDGRGFWLVAANGGVFSYGDARFRGSEGGRRLNAAVVGIAATPDGGGYWLVAGDGGVFAFGDARFRGSEGGRALNAPVVGLAAAPAGGGYWLVAADGGIFAFGNARFRGSEGGRPLSTPVVGMASTPDGGGYWLAGEDGGVFALGDAHFFGSGA